MAAERSGVHFPMTLEQECARPLSCIDSQRPKEGPLIKAMNDDDDVDWGGRGYGRWKHKTRGYSFTDAKK